MPDIKRLFKSFLDECLCVTGLSTETIRGYQASFDLLIKLFPNMVLADINYGVMVEFFTLLEKRKREVGDGIIKTGVKSSTVLTYKYKLGKFFDWLVKNKYIKENPLKYMKNPVVRYEDVQYLTKKDIEKILTAIIFTIKWQSPFIKKRNLAIFTLFIYSGLRRGELLQLKLTDIDLEKRILRVRSETSKSRRSRILTIHHKAAEFLHDYLLERRIKNYTTPYIFVSSRRDDRLDFDGLKHLVAQVKEVSGVNFHVHRFRHSAAVNMLNSGVNLVAIQQILGHTDIRMTAKYLRALPQETIAKAIESLNPNLFVG